MPYIRHLTSPGKVIFTAVYFGSMLLTLIFAIGLKSVILTIIFSVIQVAALGTFFVSYVVC